MDMRAGVDDIRAFQRLAAAAALLSVPLAFANLALGLAAVRFDVAFDSLLDPGAVATIGSTDAGLLRWSMICDLFGYYLLLAPLAVLLWSWLKPKSVEMITFYTFCGLAYALVGAIGAAMLAAIAPWLIDEYNQAVGQRREALEIVFNAVVRAVYLGLWNPLEMILGCVWWLGSGLLLRYVRPKLGIVSIVLSIFALLDVVGWILSVEVIFAIGVWGVLLLIPIWALCCSVDLLRRPVADVA
jgi:hypothetical protein